MRILTALLLSSLGAFAFADVANLISEAERLNSEARAKHNAWTPTGKFIEEARSAMAAGHSDKARVAAERAIMLATASIEQADHQQADWKTRQLVK